MVLCLDNDGVHPRQDQLIKQTVEKLQQNDKVIWIAQPSQPGWDFNDVLKKEGVQAVQKSLEQATSFGGLKSMRLSPNTPLQNTEPFDSGGCSKD